MLSFLLRGCPPATGAPAAAARGEAVRGAARHGADQAGDAPGAGGQGPGGVAGTEPPCWAECAHMVDHWGSDAVENQNQ